MSGFTPGPWHVQQERGVLRIAAANPDPQPLDTAEAPVAWVEDVRAFSGGRGPANARLIAAAPELFAAIDDVDVLAGVTVIDGPDYEVVPVLMTRGAIRCFRAAHANAVAPPIPEGMAHE